MIPTHLELMRDSRWLPPNHPFVQALPDHPRDWLTDQGSLTALLIKYSNDQFRVRVVSERWGKPSVIEAKKLQLPQWRGVRIREVELLCNEKVVVLARSIIPPQVFKEQRRTLGNMGSRPLGHLLFKKGKMRPNQRGIAIFSSPASTDLYGRSSIYRYGNGEILVSEFFIDEVLVQSPKPDL